MCLKWTLIPRLIDFLSSFPRVHAPQGIVVRKRSKHSLGSCSQFLGTVLAYHCARWPRHQLAGSHHAIHLFFDAIKDLKRQHVTGNRAHRVPLNNDDTVYGRAWIREHIQDGRVQRRFQVERRGCRECPQRCCLKQITSPLYHVFFLLRGCVVMPRGARCFDLFSLLFRVLSCGEEIVRSPIICFN